MLPTRLEVATIILALAALLPVRPAAAQTPPGQIDVLLPGRYLETVLAIPVGLPAQMALLESGAILLADKNNRRISVLGADGGVQVLAEVANACCVAALPGNRAVYSVAGEIRFHDVRTNQVVNRSSVPSGEAVNALGSDAAGSVYAGTSRNNLYRFAPDGRRDSMASNLPFPSMSAITDIAAAPSGEVYVAGLTRVVKVAAGRATVIADGLHYEPVLVAIRPDGRLYIWDSYRRLQLFDPATGASSSVATGDIVPFGDILVPSDDEIVLYEQGAAFYKFKPTTGAVSVMLTIDGNSRAFGFADDGFPYLGTIAKRQILNSRLARLGPGGALQYLDSLSFTSIYSVASDGRGGLGMIDGGGLKRVATNGSLSRFSTFVAPGVYQLAISSDGDWYVITSGGRTPIRVYRVREGATDGEVVVSLDRAMWPGSSPNQGDTGLAITPKGELAIVVAIPTLSGQCYQRVYRANPDGSALREVANLDSRRLGCMVDIAAAPNGDLYVLGCAAGSLGSPDSIFRIDESNVPVEAVRIGPGNDPRSIAVDGQGNLWFTATNGVYRVPAAPAAAIPRIFNVLGVVNGAGWNPDIAPNTWISIFGTNLAPNSRTWENKDFAGTRLPVQLDGVSVKIGGKPAYVAYVSPTQLNVLVPDVGPAGTYEVQAFTPEGASNSVTVPVTRLAPTLFRFRAANGRYAAAVHADGTYVGDPAVLPGIGATPARPGEIISLFGTGFGLGAGNADIGALVQTPQALANGGLQIRIGDVIASVKYAGLVGSGLVQLNVEVPTLADGDQQVGGAIAATVLRTSPWPFITVQTRPQGQ
jgi:uncharacterized protein (TIGR03437 family)